MNLSIYSFTLDIAENLLIFCPSNYKRKKANVQKQQMLDSTLMEQSQIQTLLISRDKTPGGEDVLRRNGINSKVHTNNNAK